MTTKPAPAPAPANPARRTVVAAGTAAGAAAFLRLGRARHVHAAGSDEIRVGVVGCGGRGSGAVAQALKAAPGVKLVAIGDAFKDRVDATMKTLSGQAEHAGKIDCPPERQFAGLDAYEKVLAADVNYVIFASPPGFRPQHLKAAVAAGKHVFTEKPVAVDGPGVRACFEVAEEAKRKGLAIGVGLQRHHHKGYIEFVKRIQGGAIGNILAARCYWLQGPMWAKPQEAGMTDLEWQLRNWQYFTWLSGDIQVEQHIHNIDVVNWVLGKKIVAATSMGGRQQRTEKLYGHVYDHFSTDYEFEGDVHVHSACRQIPKCANEIAEHFVGTKGKATTTGMGQVVGVTSGKKEWKVEQKNVPDPYLQTHIDLIGSIRASRPLNELFWATESNLIALMGRLSAYTGKKVTRDQALNSQEVLMPKVLDPKAPMPIPPVAIPGTSDVV